MLGALCYYVQMIYFVRGRYGHRWLLDSLIYFVRGRYATAGCPIR